MKEDRRRREDEEEDETRKDVNNDPASSAVLQVAIYIGWGSHAVLPKLACVSMQTQPWARRSAPK